MDGDGLEPSRLGRGPSAKGRCIELVADDSNASVTCGLVDGAGVAALNQLPVLEDACHWVLIAVATEPPHAVPFVLLIVADLDNAVRALDESWALENAIE